MIALTNAMQNQATLARYQILEHAFTETGAKVLTFVRLIDFRFIRSELKSSPPIAVPGSALKAYGKVIVR